MLKGGSLSKNDEMTVCLQLAQLQLGNLSQDTTAELGIPLSAAHIKVETLFQEWGSPGSRDGEVPRRKLGEP